MTTLVFYLLVFFVVGVFFLAFHLFLGSVVRPKRPDPEKMTIYECGEPTVGSAWVQFDLRYYVVALLFVIFDVEVAFFFPWAVVFGNANKLANPALEDKDRVAISKELIPDSIPNTDQAVVTAVEVAKKAVAKAQAQLKAAEDDRQRGAISQQDYDKAKLAYEQSVTKLENATALNADTSYQMAWLAFIDILIFFGVLLVGFAYLWRRGDIDWVRSTAAEKAAAPPVEELPVRRPQEVLVGQG